MKIVCPVCLQESMERVEIDGGLFRHHLIEDHGRQLQSSFAFNVFMATWKPEIIRDEKINTSILED
jgi:hypothetical protein